MDSDLLNFYLALLSLQMAILGFVLAGIVALMQILQSARPRRQTNLLIRPATAGLYFGFLTFNLIVLCVGTWTLAFKIEEPLLAVFQSPVIAALLLVSSLVGLFSFLAVTVRARRLLNDDDYVEAYLAHISPQTIRDYLFKAHEPRPSGDGEEAWERRYQQVKHLPDPFQPINEYLKDSAAKSYDHGTAKGLNLLGKYVDAAFEAISRNPEPQEFARLATYLHESAEEYFKLFSRLGLEKRKTDTIRLVHAKSLKFLDAPGYNGLLTLVRCLEHLARSGASETEIIMCIERMQDLTDEYVEAADATDRPWSEVGDVFEETCLCVGRIAEAYYLMADNPLHAIPMLSHNTGEYRTVTGAFVEFFSAFGHLADRFEDTYPERFFDSIEAVTEVLLTRYAEIAGTTQEKVGLGNAYQQLLRRLYGIYASVGEDAIEHGKPALLKLCVANLSQIARTAKHLELPQEYKAIGALVRVLRPRGSRAAHPHRAPKIIH